MEQIKPTKTLTLSASVLKAAAVVTMYIDHLGFTVVDRLEHSLRSYLGTGPVTAVMRMIGRIAFILFAFLLVEGFANTSNRKKYILRLIVGAFISEMPFDLVVSGSYFDPWDQNIFFTLTIGFCTIWVLDLLKKKRSEKKYAIIILEVLCVITGMVLAELIRCDYGCLGVGLIVVFYLFRWHPGRFWAALIWCFAGHILEDVIAYAVSLYKYSLSTGTVFHLERAFNWDLLKINLEASVQHRIIYTMPGIIVALLLILRYNGEKGRQLPKAFYYLFYPVHLLFLYFVMQLLPV